MAEPQPATVHEGIDMDEEAPALPKSAEDRKAAAALSSMTADNDDDEDDDNDGAHGAKRVDHEALGRAMKSLDITGGSKAAGAGGSAAAGGGGGVGAGATAGGRGGAGSKAGDADDGERSKKKAAVAVKVDQADVTLLVEELDLSKAKATDLLKAHDGDAVKALRAFVTASA